MNWWFVTLAASAEAMPDSTMNVTIIERLG